MNKNSFIYRSTISSFITYCPICDKNNRTGASNGARTAYPFEANEFTPSVFNGARVAHSLVFCVMLLFVFSAFVSQPLFYLAFFDLSFLDYPWALFNYPYTLDVRNFTNITCYKINIPLKSKLYLLNYTCS